MPRDARNDCTGVERENGCIGIDLVWMENLGEL